ncbi:hypothetical protein VTN49DRAFT_325 [Thermomyces lanuginosus]|uniref:uncharacterized protein n=1 Tax=Thermomyces lanuginosus TaxID=5541 RepID=UPI00374404DD
MRPPSSAFGCPAYPEIDRTSYWHPEAQSRERRERSSNVNFAPGSPQACLLGLAKGKILDRTVRIIRYTRKAEVTRRINVPPTVDGGFEPLDKEGLHSVPFKVALLKYGHILWARNGSGVSSPSLARGVGVQRAPASSGRPYPSICGRITSTGHTSTATGCASSILYACCGIDDLDFEMKTARVLRHSKRAANLFWREETQQLMVIHRLGEDLGHLALATINKRNAL